MRVMRFARRTGWNTEESELARAHRERLECGLPIADLTASNPARCGFDYDPELLAELANPAALDYDPQPRGLLPAREAVCAYYADHGAAVSPEQVILTTSTSEAYSFLFRLLCDPGSEILVPQPGYPLFDFLAVLDDVRLKPAPLVYDHGWQIDPEGFRRAVTPETRAIVLVHPNNPTGHFTKAWEARELAELCREYGLSLIVDEVFLDYSNAGTGDQGPGTRTAGTKGPRDQGTEKAGTKGPRDQGTEKAGNEGAREQGTEKAGSEGAREQGSGSFAGGLGEVPVFVVSGLSKIAGLPQMKAAWIVAAGPQRASALDRLEVISDTFLSMNAPVQWALPAWLARRHAIQTQIRERVAANLAELDGHLAAHAAVRRLECEGGWYAVMRIPALRPDEDTVRILLDRGVWVHPGYFFGLPASGWLVVSLLADSYEFRTGARVLFDFLGTNQGDNKSGSGDEV